MSGVSGEPAEKHWVDSGVWARGEATLAGLSSPRERGVGRAEATCAHGGGRPQAQGGQRGYPRMSPVVLHRTVAVCPFPAGARPFCGLGAKSGSLRWVP